VLFRGPLGGRVCPGFRPAVWPAGWLALPWVTASTSAAPAPAGKRAAPSTLTIEAAGPAITLSLAGVLFFLAELPTQAQCWALTLISLAVVVVAVQQPPRCGALHRLPGTQRMGLAAGLSGPALAAAVVPASPALRCWPLNLETPLQSATVPPGGSGGWCCLPLFRHLPAPRARPRLGRYTLAAVLVAHIAGPTPALVLPASPALQPYRALGRWRCSQRQPVMALPLAAAGRRQTGRAGWLAALLASLASVWWWGLAGRRLLRADAGRRAWASPIGRGRFNSSPSGSESPAVAAISAQSLEGGGSAIDPERPAQRAGIGCRGNLAGPARIPVAVGWNRAPGAGRAMALKAAQAVGPQNAGGGASREGQQGWPPNCRRIVVLKRPDLAIVCSHCWLLSSQAVNPDGRVPLACRPSGVRRKPAGVPLLQAPVHPLDAAIREVWRIPAANSLVADLGELLEGGPRQRYSLMHQGGRRIGADSDM